MIRVSHLSRRFGALLALDDVSFHLEPGEVVGFLGPNGAGKTTTMRILTGYLPATRGRVQIAGLDVFRQSLEARRKIGYLPEAVPLYRELRVEEMLTFQARLHGVPRGETRRRIPEVLERVGVLDRRRDLIGKLSKGLRQRVGLAVALLPAPEVLILDEPTSGLDPLQRIEVRKLVRELADKHTVLLSSHILPEIEAVCPRVIILHRGRIAADGTPAELVRDLGHPSFVRLEAVVSDAAEAVRLLGTLAGAKDVIDDGRLGIHHRFRILCDEDLREDVGALAAQKSWAARQLSFDHPSLEELFSRIALDLTPEEGAAIETSEAAGEELGGPAELLGSPGSGLASVAPPPTPAPRGAGPSKATYNLNPFERPAPQASDSAREPGGERTGEDAPP